MEMVKIEVVVPADLLDRLMIAAAEAGVPVGDYISLQLAKSQLESE
jgi:hypothetical protein